MSFCSRAAECDAYRKELEALSADELMKRCKNEFFADNINYKVQDGKLWFRSSGKWIVVYDAHDWYDRITVIARMRQNRSDQLFEAEWKKEHHPEEDDPSSSTGMSLFWFILCMVALMAIMIAILVIMC